MASFFAHHPRTPTCLGVPSAKLKRISARFRDLAKTAARANVQTDGRDLFDYENVGDAYMEALCGFRGLQDAIRALGDEGLTALVNDK